MRDDEFDAVVELWQRTGRLRPWNDPHRALRLARDRPDSQVLIGRVPSQGVGSEQVVASVLVGVRRAPRLAVLRRGRPRVPGSGPWAVGGGRRRGLAAGARRAEVQLMVRTGNTAPIGFYDRLGYEPQEALVPGRRLLDQ